MCSVSLVDGGNASIDLPFLLQPSSYGLCPPNMVNPAVYRLPATDEDPVEAFTDPDYEGRFKNRRGAYVPFEVLDPRPGRRWFVHEGPPPPPDRS